MNFSVVDLKVIDYSVYLPLSVIQEICNDIEEDTLFQDIISSGLLMDISNLLCTGLRFMLQLMPIHALTSFGSLLVLT